MTSIETLPSELSPPDRSGQSLRIALPAEMGIDAVEALAETFRTLKIEDKSVLSVDAAQVIHITSPGIQLLVALEKTVAARGGHVVIENRNPHLEQVFRDLALESVLGL